MAINLAKKYSSLVDENFTTESKASLITNSDYDFVGSKSIAIYSVGTAEMNDYGRNTEGTSRYGTPKDLTTDIQEESMEMDRSFTFVIDTADEDETLGALNAGTALARQMNEEVIPESDKYVYKKVVDKAGTTIEEELTNENTYDSLATANATMDEESVPEQGRIMVANPVTYKNLKADKRAVLDTEVGQELRIKGVVGEMDGTMIQKVPSRLLPENTNYILAHPVATTFAVKLAEYKIHTDAPGVSGALVEGRVYYTAFVRNNKKKAIYVSKKKSSIKINELVNIPSEDTELLGKKVNELSENLSINENGLVTGTLNHIDGYTEFSSKVDEQSGNYLPLFFKEATEGKKVKVKITKSVTLTEDGLYVGLIKNNSQKINVTIDGEESYALDLSQLVLNQE